MLRLDSDVDLAPQDAPTHEDLWFSWAPVGVPLSGAFVLAAALTVWSLVL
jgi:glycerol uptake facilitator-like aquaporin